MKLFKSGLELCLEGKVDSINICIHQVHHYSIKQVLFFVLYVHWLGKDYT